MKKYLELLRQEITSGVSLATLRWQGDQATSFEHTQAGRFNSRGEKGRIYTMNSIAGLED